MIIYQHHMGKMVGNVYQTKDGFYYKIYYKIDGKNKTIARSYVNFFDRAVCEDRMITDMELIDKNKLARP